MYLHRGRHVPGWRIWLGHRSLAGHRFETLCSFLPTFCVCPSLRWRPCWTRRMTWTKRQTTQLPSNLLQCKGQLFSAVPSSQCRWILIHCLDSCHVNKNKNPWKLACDGIGTNTSWCTETWRSLTSPPPPIRARGQWTNDGKTAKSKRDKQGWRNYTWNVPDYFHARDWRQRWRARVWKQATERQAKAVLADRVSVVGRQADWWAASCAVRQPTDLCDCKIGTGSHPVHPHRLHRHRCRKMPRMCWKLARHPLKETQRGQAGQRLRA